MKNRFTIFLLFFFQLAVISQEVYYNPFEQALPPLEYEGQYCMVMHGLQEFKEGKILFAIVYSWLAIDSTDFYPYVDSMKFKICIADKAFNIEKSVGIKRLESADKFGSMQIITDDNYIYAVTGHYRINELDPFESLVKRYKIFQYDHELNLLNQSFIEVSEHTTLDNHFDDYKMLINHEGHLVFFDAYDRNIFEFDNSLTAIHNVHIENLENHKGAFFQMENGDYYIVNRRFVYRLNSTFELITVVDNGIMDNPYSIEGEYVNLNGEIYLGGVRHVWDDFPRFYDRAALYKFNPGTHPNYELIGEGDSYEPFGFTTLMDKTFSGYYEDHLYNFTFYTITPGFFGIRQNRLSSFKSDGTLNWEVLLMDQDVSPMGITVTRDSGVIVQVVRERNGYNYGPSEIAKFDKDGNLEEITGVAEMMLPEKARITVSPNPFEGEITINSDIWQKQPTFLSLYDIKGSEVLKKRITGATIIIPDIPLGLYFYAIRQNGVIVGSGKLVKEKRE